VFLELSAPLGNEPIGSWRQASGIFLACLLAFWVCPGLLLATIFLVARVVPRALSTSHLLNSVTAFLFTLPQVVFPYWGLAPQDEHHWLVAWKNRAPLLGLGTAWGVTVLQWGTAAIAFGALACRLKHVWQVVAAALIAIVLVTGVALAVFAILKLMVQVEGI